MKFSLIIATLNRPDILFDCLLFVSKQTYKDFEVIIIDQSDDDGIKDKLSIFEINIKYVRTKIRGLSRARNIGIKLAKGEYICLVDDDGFYENNVLEKANEVIMKTSPDVLGGQIVDRVAELKLVDRQDGYVSWLDVFKTFMSPSMIIKKNFIEKVLFDEQFGVGAKYGSGEESDIVFRALSGKNKVYFTNLFRVNHSLTKNDSDRVYSYAYGYGALCKKIYNKYSVTWGLYFIMKSCVGNFVLGYLLYPIFKKNNSVMRKNKFKYILKGFMDYKI